MKMKSSLCCLLLTGFLLGVHQDRIALWRDDDPQPEVVFPCPVHMLPPADQKALTKGIRVENREELARLLEDYCS